jgi:hypothetical protein
MMLRQGGRRFMRLAGANPIKTPSSRNAFQRHQRRDYPVKRSFRRPFSTQSTKRTGKSVPGQ